MFEKEKITIAYVSEKCTQCGNQVKRKFTAGDILFAKTAKCTLCDGTFQIEKIFGEVIEQ